VIEGEFKSAEGAETISFSHGDFGLVVQTLDDATGKQLLSPEIIEDQLAVLTAVKTSRGRSIPLAGSSTGSSPRRLANARRHPQISSTRRFFN
jgi:hypothetical protein